MKKPRQVMMHPTEIMVGFAPHTGVLWIHTQNDEEKISIGLSYDQIEEFFRQIEEAKKQVANPSF